MRDPDWAQRPFRLGLIARWMMAALCGVLIVGCRPAAAPERPSAAEAAAALERLIQRQRADSLIADPDAPPPTAIVLSLEKRADGGWWVIFSLTEDARPVSAHPHAAHIKRLGRRWEAVEAAPR